MDFLRFKSKTREFFGGGKRPAAPPPSPVTPAAQAASPSPSAPSAPVVNIIPKYQEPYTKLPKVHPQMNRLLYSIDISTEPRSPRIHTKAEGDGLTILDVNQHSIVLGETGTGKTLRWLHHVYEGFYKSTHLAPKDNRDARKFCGLIIDGKTDFTPTSWSLAKKYGRTGDMIFFGPEHLDISYDPFGDEEETPMQRSNKMLELIRATKPDAGGGDPFWDNAASKLFQNIFLLHKAAHETCPERVPRMSFRLLNQLCTDKGVYRNQGEIQAHNSNILKLVSELYQTTALMRKLAYSLQPELEKAHSRILDLQEDLKVKSKEAQDDWQEANATFVKARSKAKESGNDADKKEVGKLEKEALAKAQVLKRIADRNGKVGMAKKSLGGFHQLDNLPDIPGTLSLQLQYIGNESASYEHAKAEKRGEIEQMFFRSGYILIKKLYADLSQIESDIFGELCYGGLKDFCDRYSTILSLMTTSAGLMKEEPKKKSGQMRKMLDIYQEKVLKPKNIAPEDDPVCEYFEGEHLNVCNDKTAGSVGMVATNMCNGFVHEPFCYMFREDATWTWKEVIDQGKIVVMDMPFVTYQAAAVMASLLLKTDFFRAVLSRKLLKMIDPVTGQERLINQEREILYLVDEFQTVASTGKITGESGFLDRCRSNRCSCVFATQSLSNFYASLSERDGEAMLANLVMKVFFRNSCPKTTDYASKISGDYTRLSININSSATSQYFGSNKEVGSTGGTQSTQKGARHEPAFFTTLSDGEAMLRLPSRFGTSNILVTKLALRIIKDPAPDYLLPTCMEARPLGNTMIQDEKKPEEQKAAA